MAATGLVRFCRRFSSKIVASPVKELRIYNHKYVTSSRNFYTKCPDQGSTPVLMPALSPTMTEGTIVKWLKKEGDAVAPGDVLCEIQTDKAVVSMEVDEEGILAKILKAENSSDVKIGTMIAVMVEEGDDWQSVEIPDAPSATPTKESSPPPPSQSAPASPPQQAPTETSHTQSSIGPSVRKLLEEYNLRSTQVNPSGPHGRLLKGDVLKHIESNKLKKQDLKVEPPSTPTAGGTPSPVSPAAPQPVVIPGEEEEFIDIPLTNMRRTIAKRLTQSKTTIPHSYITIDSNLGAVTKLRKQLIAEGVKVSMNDFIIKASAIALQRVPAVNSVFQYDEITLMSNVDISVAVATDQGLITPIVHNAAHLAVDDISRTVKDLAVKAREGKLQLHEFQGGTFTISNLGMFGISEFSAVINPPQTAIMAIGSSRLVAGEDGTPQTNMTVTLSYDSQAIDETQASQFLEVFKDVMENPSIMIVGSTLAMKRQAAEAL